jgi:hypothetical protein
MAAELRVRLEPGIADIFRANLSQTGKSDPATSGVLDYLAAVRLGARLWFSDGRALWSADNDVWHFADQPNVARIITKHPYPRDEAVQALPRAFPLGAVGTDAMLWVLRWYDTDHAYVCAPILLDAARRKVRVLRPTSRRHLEGTAPKRLLTTDDPQRLVITGQLDAGAAADIDDYIMVDVAWEVDLTSGTYRYTDKFVGKAASGLLAVSYRWELSQDGLGYHSHDIRLDSDTSTFTVRDHDDILTLELRTDGHATVRRDQVRPT